VGYYGTDSDRALIRSYLSQSEGDSGGSGEGSSGGSGVGSGLGSLGGLGGFYTERSPCHVLVANYEGFMSDISYFKKVCDTI
jgi:hypothetical protein